jgi:hypothetical protein
MDVKFFAGNPREKARPVLDDILSRGTDQLAIAAAFCTGAGAKILQQHSDRLKKGGSFVVVSAGIPTDYEALKKLHGSIGDSLYVHLGALLPYETKNGAALMHSKVFYARRGSECWLWTGSHNLTVNATQGANCEAAVLLHGDEREQPFVDAMQHLEACRNEATPFSHMAPPIIVQRDDVVAIHAEMDVTPTDSLPWHVHLCLETDQYDEMLRPPVKVRLYLYSPGRLQHGWWESEPVRVLKGKLTGLNLTARNPDAADAGTQAQWRTAEYGITETRGVLAFGLEQRAERTVATQAVISISGDATVRDDAVVRDDGIISEYHFSKPPRIEFQNVLGPRAVRNVDPDVREFFSPRSVEGQNLVHLPIARREQVIKVPAEETRSSDRERLRQQLSQGRDLPLVEETPVEDRRRERHPCILRMKYRLPRQP